MHSQMPEVCPGGGCWSFELIGALPPYYKRTLFKRNVGSFLLSTPYMETTSCLVESLSISIRRRADTRNKNISLVFLRRNSSGAACFSDQRSCGIREMVVSCLQVFFIVAVVIIPRKSKSTSIILADKHANAYTANAYKCMYSLWDKLPRYSAKWQYIRIPGENVNTSLRTQVKLRLHSICHIPAADVHLVVVTQSIRPKGI